jgi:hypothetical protein
VLGEGLQRAEVSEAAFAERFDLSKPTLYTWRTGRASPSEAQRSAMPEMDRYLGMNGRLVAAFSAYTPQKCSRDAFSPDQKEALSAGNGTLHQLVRYWAQQDDEVTLRPLFKAAQMREHLYQNWLCLPLATRGVPGLQSADRSAFEHIDRELDAKGKIVAAFDKQLAAQGAQSVRIGFPYREWSEQLKREFKHLETYKFKNPQVLGRSKKGVWTQSLNLKGDLESQSSNTTRKYFEQLFGHAITACGLKPEELRLAHVVVPEVVTGFILARMSRTDRDKFNQADYSHLGISQSLIYSGGELGGDFCGYFVNDAVAEEYWDDPYIAARLPLSFVPQARGGYQIAVERIAIPPDNKRARWHAFLAESCSKFRRFTHSKGKAESDRFYHRVQNLIENPDYDLGKWLKDGFAKLINSAPPRHSAPIAWAKHVRKCVLYMLVVTRAFRRMTLARLELRHIVPNSDKTKYHFDIEEDLFKQKGKGGSKGGVQAEVDDVLLLAFEMTEKPLIDGSATALLRLYVEEARPLLGIKSNSFFGLEPESLGTAFSQTTKTVFGREVNLHAIRYVLATWCLRQGISVEDTAAILGHLPSATKLIYSHLTAVDVGRKSNKSVKQAFAKRFAA